MTTLTGSVLIPLAVAARALSPEEAWDAAHVDERYQESVWGEDEEAMIRRAGRWEDFAAAATVYRLAGA
jgi:chaperone required for assembly of F1-ATPase